MRHRYRSQKASNIVEDWRVLEDTTVLRNKKLRNKQLRNKHTRTEASAEEPRVSLLRRRRALATLARELEELKGGGARVREAMGGNDRGVEGYL